MKNGTKLPSSENDAQKRRFLANSSSRLWLSLTDLYRESTTQRRRVDKVTRGLFTDAVNNSDYVGSKMTDDE